MEEELQDVSIEAPDTASTEVADSSPAVEPSDESQGSVTATDAAAEAQVEVDPLKDVPTVEELQEQANQKVPYAQALAQLRPAYEGLKTQLDSYKPLDAWKPLAETIGDPAIAQSQYELINAIHTPDPNSTSGFTSQPFLQQLDAQSPGTVEQIVADGLRFQIPDPQGNPSTVVRELYRSHGLDPDRIDDYRNIDTLRASSGVVTAEDLSQIDARYHAAFKQLSQTTREDLLQLKETNPIAADEYLRNAQEALEVKQWREQNEQATRQRQEQEQEQFRQQVANDVQADLLSEVKSIHDSIHQELAAKVTFSSDPQVNALEQAKVMATLATLQNPAYRFVAENALKAVGADITGFDELANRWEERRSAHTYFKAIGDQMQAQRALSESTAAKQQMLIKLNSWAQKLAKVNGERLAGAASQQQGTMAAAAARFVPTGQGTQQTGNQNPYMQNPHPVGSQEYFAFNRKLDREYNLTNASVYGG